MARPLRIEYPGAWYHVMNRGLGRRQIFTKDYHREYFLSLLAAAAERFDADWHAYCLMDNHYHLLLHTPCGNLQRIMRHVNGIYTQYYNRACHRDGPLFRGRYKAVLVDADSYWTELTRYIHRNPLEAGLVTSLIEYRWSSYPIYLGRVRRPEWLNCAYTLSAIGQRNVRARYRAFIESDANGGIEVFYARKRQGSILGDDAFKRRLDLKGKTVDIPELRAARSRPSVAAIVASVAERLDVEQEEIWRPRHGRAVKSPARPMTMYLFQHLAEMRLAEIAEHFGLRHYASASSNIRQFEARMRDDKQLRQAVDAIMIDLTP